MQNLRQRVGNLLRWSERYTKTDMVYLAKGGFWLTLGQAIASVSSFFLAIAFANLLTQESYGTYKYILAVSGTLGIFTLTGMGTAVTQAVARGVNNILIPAFKMRMRWGLITTVVSFVGAIYYYLNENIVLSAGLLIIGIFMPFMEALGTYDSIWQGKKRFDVSTRYSILGNILSAIALITTLFFTQNIVILVLAYFSSWTLLRLIFFKRTAEDTTSDSEDISPTLSYGKHLSLMGAIGVIANYADRILMFHFTGAAGAAVYSIAIAIPEQIKGMVKNFGTLALPKFSGRTDITIDKHMWRKMGKLAIILIATILFYIFSAPYIFNILFPQYLDSIFYSQIYSISILASVSIIPLSFLQAHKKQEELYIFNTSYPIIQLLLLVFGAYFYGIWGIIGARIIGRFVNSVILFWFFRN